MTEVELELELLLQPAAASSAAATAAKPILLCLRTVVPPGVGGSCRVISLECRGPGLAGASRGPLAGGRSCPGGRSSEPPPHPLRTAVPGAGSGFRQARLGFAPWPAPMTSRNLNELPQERPGVKYP